MKKIKILHILYSEDVGGIAKINYMLAKIQAQDAELETAFLFGKGEGWLFNKVKYFGVKIYNIGLKSGFDFSLLKLIKIVNIMKNYDILQYHSFNPILAIAGIISGKNIVYHEHSTFGIGRKVTSRDRIKQILKRYFLKMYAKKIIANSNFTKAIATKMVSPKDDRIFNVIYHGLDEVLPERTKAQVKKDLGIPEDYFIVGTAGKLVHVKRIDRLIDAYLSARVDNSYLVIAGDGPLKNKLINYANEIGLKGKVIFTGNAPYIYDLMNIFDIFILPSQAESFGLVVIEAARLGIPLAVFEDSGGAKEVVDMIGGIIVKDIKEMTDVIRESYENRGHRPDYRNLDFFSVARMNEDLKKLYQDVVNE